MIRLVFALLVSLSLSACGVESRSECMERELARIGQGLSQGAAIYGGASNPTAVYSPGHRQSEGDASRRLVMASLTKPLVAAEVRKLAGNGEFELGASVRDVLASEYAWADRIDGNITVRHLLQHLAGFDSALTGDPIFRGTKPGSCDEAIGIALGRRLDHRPGDVTSYSNVGYCILGKLVQARGGDIDPDLAAALASDLGGAGGLFVSLDKMHSDLLGTLPLEDWSTSASLPDGSYYTSGWRRWPSAGAEVAPWTHFGRLQGILAVAVTDGKESVVVAHFEGDPHDPSVTAKAFADRAWRCMGKPESPP